MTTKNKDFEDSTNSIIREWEKGTDYTYEEIKTKSLESYRNIIARYKRLNKPWLKPAETSRSDDRDIQIQALRTEINALKTFVKEMVVVIRVTNPLDSSDPKILNLVISLNRGENPRLRAILVLKMVSNGGGVPNTNVQTISMVFMLPINLAKDINSGLRKRGVTSVAEIRATTTKVRQTLLIQHRLLSLFSMIKCVKP